MSALRGWQQRRVGLEGVFWGVRDQGSHTATRSLWECYASTWQEETSDVGRSDDQLAHVSLGSSAGALVYAFMYVVVNA